MSITTNTSGTNYPDIVDVVTVDDNYNIKVLSKVTTWGDISNGGAMTLPDSYITLDTGDENMIYPFVSKTMSADITSALVVDASIHQVNITVNLSISFIDSSSDNLATYQTYATEGVPMYYKFGSGSWNITYIPFSAEPSGGVWSGSGTVVLPHTMTESEWNQYGGFVEKIIYTEQSSSSKSKRPSISLSYPANGQVSVTYKNQDTVAGILYYRRNTGSWATTSIGAGGTRLVKYTGTPLTQFSLDCYFIADLKIMSNVASVYTLYPLIN